MKTLVHRWRFPVAVGLSCLILSMGVAQAQDVGPTLDIMNSVVTTMILVVIVVALLVVVGGLVMFLRLRQLNRVTREQRTKIAELHALYRELYTARKRTDGAIAQISGKSAESDANAAPGATTQAAMSRLAQAAALVSVGERQYRAQDYGGALTTYLRASELDDDSPLIHYRVGYTQIQVNQLDRAMTHLNSALEIDGHFLPARAALGYLYRRLSEAPNMDEQARAQMLEEAEHHLSNAMMRAPRMLDEDDEAWMTTLAGIYRRRREYDRALSVYSEASNITPFSSYPYASVALVYADKNDYPQMFRNYERVEWRARKEIGARPTDPWGHINLLLARVALGRDDKLIEEEFTLSFLSLPKDAAFILPTLVSSMKRLEWALADAKQPARAERAAFLVRRIEHLESTNEPHSTQVMNIMPDDRKRRTTSALRAVDNGDKRATSSELPTTQELTNRNTEWPDID